MILKKSKIAFSSTEINNNNKKSTKNKGPYMESAHLDHMPLTHRATRLHMVRSGLSKVTKSNNDLCKHLLKTFLTFISLFTDPRTKVKIINIRKKLDLR